MCQIRQTPDDLGGYPAGNHNGMWWYNRTNHSLPRSESLSIEKFGHPKSSGGHVVLLAQLVERTPCDRLVVGSNPTQHPQSLRRLVVTDDVSVPM